MGSSSHSQFKPSTQLYQFLNYKYCKVWVRKSDKVQQLEQYSLHIVNSSDYQQYQKMFLLRIQHQYFPNNLYFLAKPSNNVCGDSKIGSILIQRIPYRLCQFINILYNDAISILFKCFKAYSILYQKYGMFKVKTTMMCLDKKYSIKVWHHTDLSSPFPEDPFCRSLLEMIQQIIWSIEKISSYPYNIHRFSQYLQIKSIKLLNFQSALKYLQIYAAQNQIKITDNLQSIQRFLKQAQGLASNTKNKLNRTSSSQNFHASPSNMNKSLTKYSFKDNSIICVTGNSTYKSSTSNLYLNSNTENRSKSDFKVTRSQNKTKLSFTYSPSSTYLKNCPKMSFNNTYNQGFNYPISKRHSLVNSLGSSDHNSIKKDQPKQKELMPESLNSQSRNSQKHIKMNKVYGVSKKLSSPNDITQTKQSKSRVASPSVRSVKTIVSTETISLLQHEQYMKNLSRLLRKQFKDKDNL